MICPGGYRIRPKIHALRGVKLGSNVWISQYVYIDELHPEAISIGDNCSIGLRTSIFSHLYWGPRKAQNGFKRVVIADDVYIGPHCVILPGVKVGKGAVVRGGSVIARNIPSYTFIASPDPKPVARITVPLTNEYSYEDFVQGLRPLRRRSKDKGKR
jgi:acetyltransferase-like isoleucine patch superfamily enzyme